MKFVDEATLLVIAGNGGSGCVSFRREKYVPRGCPNGGDGGDGGSVFLVGRAGLSTLADFRVTRKFKAGNGEQGAGRNRTGKSGDDLTVDVPCGTHVYERDTGELIGDITVDQQRLLVAAGGHGGKGNTRFKSSTNRAPRRSTPGTPCERRSLRLELTVLADTGLLGMPNAGKSTLIRSVSAARPRVAAYPFTSLVPTLGVVEQGESRFVLADIPGLIEGAGAGMGLGDRFLRHVERAQVLVHVLDLAAMLTEGRDLRADYDALRKELGQYRPELLCRREIVLLNKIDLVPDSQPQGTQRTQTKVDEVETILRSAGCQVLRTSGSTGQGTRELVAALIRALDEAGPALADGGDPA